MSTMKKILLSLYISVAAAALAIPARAIEHRHPDLDKIKTESTNPQSPYFYDKLAQKFLANDTTMTTEEYKYFYYGTMFQEDYNPYRPNPYQKELAELTPLYYKTEHQSRKELEKIEQFAQKALQDNPLDLRQIMYLAYNYEKTGKDNKAAIWRAKLRNILLTISSSGTGEDPEHAWVIVYPSHEFDYFNISGVSVDDRDFVPPYYEKVTVVSQKKNAKGAEEQKTATYYFDLHRLLEQYYAKHPEENK
jgi:hypothetical protein